MKPPRHPQGTLGEPSRNSQGTYAGGRPGVHGKVRYGTVRYGTVQYGTVRYGTLRYGKLGQQSWQRQMTALGAAIQRQMTALGAFIQCQLAAK